MKALQFAVLAGSLLLFAGQSPAHFGMVIPSTNIVTQDDRQLRLDLSFSHPFEGIGMDMVKPAAFAVVCNDTATDLVSELRESRIMEHRGWTAQQKIDRPCVYQYIMEPQPYWEPAEDVYIIHYTKTIVAAFGEDSGWQKPVGLPIEIVPQLRPYGNYAGNTFSGKVLVKGEPAAGIEVEVEFYNREGSLQPPTDYHITQVVTTDENGIFSFACPLPGWWGFSALSEADQTMPGPDGDDKAVEIGGVIWSYFHPLP